MSSLLRSARARADRGRTPDASAFKVMFCREENNVSCMGLIFEKHNMHGYRFTHNMYGYGLTYTNTCVRGIHRSEFITICT